MWKKHLCIVFAIEHYNPLGQIRSLGEAGVHPIYIAIKGKIKIASSSKYISECHYAESINEGYDILINKYGSIAKTTGIKPYVFCSDDKTIGYLDLHYNDLKDKFIFFNAGKQGRVNYFMDKKNILNLAKKHGLKVLDAQVCQKGKIPKDIIYPIITKSISPNVGGWKSDVFICHNEYELKLAYEKIESETILIQKYIDKKNEYCIEGFSANNGNNVFIAIASTYNYLLPDYYSPFMTVQNMENNYIESKLISMFREIGFEGIFEVEFLIDQDETYYFSEINFRNSTWSYAATKAGMPLPILWAETQENGYIKKDAYQKIEGLFTAMVEPIDYAKRVKTGTIDLAQWYIDFKEAKCGYYYSIDDIEPWRICVNNWELLG